MNTQLTLGRVIRSRRMELGLTQEALAERIGDGMRQAEVARLEHDRVVLPRRARLERIAKALELPIGELLARSGWAGADGVPWTQVKITADAIPDTWREDMAFVSPRTGEKSADELAAVIESARETIYRTERLLSRSIRTVDLVSQSVARGQASKSADQT